MSQRGQDDRLTRLQQRIAEQRARQDGEKSDGKAGKAQHSAYQLMLRLLADLGVAFVAGLLLGWGMDTWLNTRPWGLLGGALLGLAAGVRNVLYTADSVSRASRHDDVHDDADAE